ncbi:uncharacterized protein LOC129216692 [Uloborus diversus]|uniref:uncharacterized protein LOC129216692 n=1 Tax=Uloborus diversus TaxID=327109 RepID=UPI00240A1626|nr:uncharacterized protein LOC129216692 [Uloborus diversus]
MTLILRMAVSDRPGCAEPDRSRRTDRWRRALSSNNVTHPEVLTQFDRHITLALTMDSGEIIAYPLRGIESLWVDPFYSILGNFQRAQEEASSEEYSMDIGRLPVVHSHVFAAFTRVLKMLRKEYCAKEKNDHLPISVGAEVCIAASSDMDLKTTTVLNPNLKVLKAF